MAGSSTAKSLLPCRCCQGVPHSQAAVHLRGDETGQCHRAGGTEAALAQAQVPAHPAPPAVVRKLVTLFCDPLTADAIFT